MDLAQGLTAKIRALDNEKKGLQARIKVIDSTKRTLTASLNAINPQPNEEGNPPDSQA